MHANYLGLRGQKSGAAAAGSSRYSRAASQASPSTRCQKCLGLGHYTADCTNKREYKVRPTRTQILKNPKLRTPLTESAPVRTEEMPKEGTAAAILAANEAKRQAKLAKAEQERGRSRRRGSVSSSSGGSSRSSSTGSSYSSYSGSSRSRSRSDSRGRSRSRSPEQEGQDSQPQPESEPELEPELEQVALSLPQTTHHRQATQRQQHPQSEPIPIPLAFSVKVKVPGRETSSTRITLAGSVAQPEHVGFSSLAVVATAGE